MSIGLYDITHNELSVDRWLKTTQFHQIDGDKMGHKTAWSSLHKYGKCGRSISGSISNYNHNVISYFTQWRATQWRVNICKREKERERDGEREKERGRISGW